MVDPTSLLLTVPYASGLTESEDLARLHLIQAADPYAISEADVKTLAGGLVRLFKDPLCCLLRRDLSKSKHTVARCSICVPSARRLTDAHYTSQRRHPSGSHPADRLGRTDLEQQPQLSRTTHPITATSLVAGRSAAACQHELGIRQSIILTPLLLVSKLSNASGQRRKLTAVTDGYLSSEMDRLASILEMLNRLSVVFDSLGDQPDVEKIIADGNAIRLLISIADGIGSSISRALGGSTTKGDGTDAQLTSSSGGSAAPPATLLTTEFHGIFPSLLALRSISKWADKVSAQSAKSRLRWLNPVVTMGWCLKKAEATSLPGTKFDRNRACAATSLLVINVSEDSGGDQQGPPTDLYREVRQRLAPSVLTTATQILLRGSPRMGRRLRHLWWQVLFTWSNFGADPAVPGENGGEADVSDEAKSLATMILVLVERSNEENVECKRLLSHLILAHQRLITRVAIPDCESSGISCSLERAYKIWRLIIESMPPDENDKCVQLPEPGPVRFALELPVTESGRRRPSADLCPTAASSVQFRSHTEAHAAADEMGPRDGDRFAGKHHALLKALLQPSLSFLTHLNILLLEVEPQETVGIFEKLYNVLLQVSIHPTYFQSVSSKIMSAGTLVGSRIVRYLSDPLAMSQPYDKAYLSELLERLAGRLERRLCDPSGEGSTAEITTRHVLKAFDAFGPLAKVLFGCWRALLDLDSKPAGTILFTGEFLSVVEESLRSDGVGSAALCSLKALSVLFKLNRLSGGQLSSSSLPPTVAPGEVPPRGGSPIIRNRLTGRPCNHSIVPDHRRCILLGDESLLTGLWCPENGPASPSGVIASILSYAIVLEQAATTDPSKRLKHLAEPPAASSKFANLWNTTAAMGKHQPPAKPASPNSSLEAESVASALPNDFCCCSRGFSCLYCQAVEPGETLPANISVQLMMALEGQELCYLSKGSASSVWEDLCAIIAAALYREVCSSCCGGGDNAATEMALTFELYPSAAACSADFGSLASGGQGPVTSLELWIEGEEVQSIDRLLSERYPDVVADYFRAKLEDRLLCCEVERTSAPGYHMCCAPFQLDECFVSNDMIALGHRRRSRRRRLLISLAQLMSRFTSYFSIGTLVGLLNYFMSCVQDAASTAYYSHEDGTNQAASPWWLHDCAFLLKPLLRGIREHLLHQTPPVEDLDDIDDAEPPGAPRFLSGELYRASNREDNSSTDISTAGSIEHNNKRSALTAALRMADEVFAFCQGIPLMNAGDPALVAEVLDIIEDYLLLNTLVKKSLYSKINQAWEGLAVFLSYPSASAAVTNKCLKILTDVCLLHAPEFTLSVIGEPFLNRFHIWLDQMNITLPTASTSVAHDELVQSLVRFATCASKYRPLIADEARERWAQLMDIAQPHVFDGRAEHEITQTATTTV